MGPIRKMPPAWLDTAMPHKRIAFVIVKITRGCRGPAWATKVCPGPQELTGGTGRVSRGCCWAHWRAWGSQVSAVE